MSTQVGVGRVIAAIGLTAAAGCASVAGAGTAPAGRPNILWLTCEDMGPHIGPYGDRYAVTPNLDRLAAQGMRYTAVWSNAPVCAPARTTLISGMYPPSTGSEHMRSLARLPSGFKLYPQLLREAGYYCTNNVKEDYNLEKPGKVWDESSARAHWKNRPARQPFFAVFNFTVTHESQIRKRPHRLVHDPAKAPVPSYHPDTPETRHDWAQYYDNITTMDAQVGERLRELEDAGLAGETVVFFYSDHGSGMPRSKRTPCDSGLRVPLIIRVPAKLRHLAPDFRAGGTSDRPLGFVDFAPTLLSLAGARRPDYYQGRAFMGKDAGPAQRYLHGFRGRMDERYDLARSARDERYVYIRNYMPHRPAGQHVAYQFETPTTRVWKELFDAGKLTEVQKRFWETRAPEELYNLRTDPEEVRNLAALPEHRATLERLRKEQQAHARRIRDTGFLPEGELRARAAGSTPYEMARDDGKYPLARIMAAAEAASRPEGDAMGRLEKLYADPDSAVRYWAVTGALVRCPGSTARALPLLRRALKDASPYVRITAAEGLGRYGAAGDLEAALGVLRETAAPEKDFYAAISALAALDELGRKARPLLPVVRTLSDEVPGKPQRSDGYVRRLVEKIVANCGE